MMEFKGPSTAVVRRIVEEQSQPRCQCGFTACQVPTLWCVSGADRWAPAKFFCPTCLPEELRPDAGF